MAQLPPSIRLVAIARNTNSVATGGSWLRAHPLQIRPHSSRRTISRSSLRLQCLSNPISIPLFWRSRTIGIGRSYATAQDASQSMMQSAVGKGASSIPEEAQQGKERLQAPDYLNEKEKTIFEKLERELEPVRLEVQDISGGCGSMYGIEIVSERFRGLSMLRQQRLVNEVLGEEIKGWHGVQLKTRVP